MAQVHQLHGYTVVNKEPVDIPIQNVVFVDTIYPRPWGLDTEKVEEFMDSMEMAREFPPLTLNKPNNHLLDGLTRLRAKQKRHEVSVKVNYIDIPTDPMSEFLASMTLNSAHGQSFTKAQKKLLVEKAYRMNPDAEPALISQALNLPIQIIYTYSQAVRDERLHERDQLVHILSMKHKKCSKLPEGVECTGQQHSLREIEAIMKSNGFTRIDHVTISRIITETAVPETATGGESKEPLVTTDEIVDKVMDSKNVKDAVKKVSRMKKVKAKQVYGSRRHKSRVAKTSVDDMMTAMKKKYRSKEDELVAARRELQENERIIQLLRDAKGIPDSITCTKCGAQIPTETLMVMT